MESQLSKLWHTLLINLGSGSDRALSTTLDWETVQRRLNSEGEEFLTLTLPGFGKDFERSLDQGFVSAYLFKGWARHKGKSHPGNPIFLGQFLDRVFDRRTGILLDDPDIHSIWAIRQLTGVFAKLKEPTTSERAEKALDGYIECEQEVRAADAARSLEDELSFQRAASVLWGSVFQQMDEDVFYGRLIPKHGPGATADRIKGNLKFDDNTWTHRLEEYFPIGEYLCPSPRYENIVAEKVNLLEPGAELPVKVVLVPKTAKTPRIIAEEPTCMMYAQQALKRSFCAYLESDFVTNHVGVRTTNPGAGLVGFEDQTPNQRLALEGSLDGELATLDLSEASDRVSVQLVQRMLERYPNFLGALMACRSTRADVPGRGVIPLAKFASMGSAMTFPVEAVVFSTIAVLAIAESLSVPVTRRLLKQLKGQVRVYGDDIIVPRRYAVSVATRLESYGFKVNHAKSFWTGLFRESCGKEYYAGHDVSIVKLRKRLPRSLTHVEEVQSSVAFRNLCYEAGLWQVAADVDTVLHHVLRRHYPIVEPTSDVLGRVSVIFPYQEESLCPRLHVPLVKGYVAKPEVPSSRIDGLAALLKCFVQSSDQPIADTKHLQRGGRPVAVSFKLGLARPF